MEHRVSIIIPTLNESQTLGRALRCLKILEPPPWEIVVVDGGSQDETLEIAKSAGVSVICCSQSGRAVQMNQGAQQATGNILCFLHADTWLPDDGVEIMVKTLADPQISAGGFISLMSGIDITHWGISALNVLKTFWIPLFFRPWLFFRGFRLLFGDQVIFCRRQDFWDCQGYDDNLPIMEEADLCRKLSNYGRICQINRTVESSNRRVINWGTGKAVFIYLLITILWGLGVSEGNLKRFYEEIR